ncbi:MAG: YoaK family protein [Myxococcota bacterium]
MPFRPDIPRWVYAGGFALAATAGYVNAVTVASAALPVSHMSGTVTHLAIGLGSRGDVDAIMRLGGMLAGFFVGAVLSGAIVGVTALRVGRRYGVALMIEGCLFGLSTWSLGHHVSSGIILSAVACGLQNAMAATYYGLVVRTTHVTGMVTDLGVLLGQRLRTGETETWRAVVLLVLVGGFFLGGIVGAAASLWLGNDALWIPSLGCFVSGLIYVIWRVLRLRAEPSLGSD